MTVAIVADVLMKKNKSGKSDLLLSHYCTLFVAAVASFFPERGKKTRKQKTGNKSHTIQSCDNKYTFT